MKLYRLHTTLKAGESMGFEFFASKRDAERALSRWQKIDEGQGSIEQIEVEATRTSIILALNTYAGHPDNG